jgi:hypothetical protein
VEQGSSNLFVFVEGSCGGGGGESVVWCCGGAGTGWWWWWCWEPASLSFASYSFYCTHALGKFLGRGQLQFGQRRGDLEPGDISVWRASKGVAW